VEIWRKEEIRQHASTATGGLISVEKGSVESWDKRIYVLTARRLMFGVEKGVKTFASMRETGDVEGGKRRSR